MERTFLMLKPDAVQRSLIGEIIKRFEDRGLKVVAMKFMAVPRKLAEEHYAEHKGKPFFERLLAYVMSGPVLPFVVEGYRAVPLCRKMVGVTDPQEADVGTIRGDFVQQKGFNMIHASDSPESAKREIALWFRPEELVEWDKIDTPWMTESGYEEHRARLEGKKD